MAYLSKAAWDPATTPEGVYRDQWKALCGDSCVTQMLDAMRQVERATVLLELHALGFAFPVNGMLMKHWTPKPLAKEILEVQNIYSSPGHR